MVPYVRGMHTNVRGSVSDRLLFYKNVNTTITRTHKSSEDLTVRNKVLY